jgi:hypothetical protein
MRGRRAHVRCFGRRWYIEAFLSRCLSISAKSTESLGADSNRLPLLQLRVCGQWLLGVAGVCKSAYLEGFPFPALPTVAGYCVRVRVKLGSMCQESVDKTSSVALRSTGGWACGLPTRFRYLLHNAEVISVQARLFVRSGRTPGREEGATKASLPPVPAKVQAPLCIGVPTS